MTMFSATIWIFMVYIVFLCLEVSGKGTVFSCVGEYCMKRDSPINKPPEEDDSSRQYIICTDDGKGDISCKYASKEEADKEPTSKGILIRDNGEPDAVNSVLAAGDPSEIMDDEAVKAKISFKNDTFQKEGSGPNSTLSRKATANVDRMNNTKCTNGTKNGTLCQNETLSEFRENLKSTLAKEGSQALANETQYRVLWVFSKMFEWWSFGYNGVWKLLKSGKCPMPWLTSSRLHCNAVEGDEASWTVIAVSFALFPVMGYICLIRV